MLSILSGTLFGGVEGFIIVAICATSGACLCYTLSSILAKGLVVRCMPKRVIQFSRLISRHRENELSYLLFFRVTPILPNISINVISPIINIPLWKFALATFFGLMPLNIVHIKTGLILSEVEHLGGFNLN